VKIKDFFLFREKPMRKLDPHEFEGEEAGWKVFFFILLFACALASTFLI